MIKMTYSKLSSLMNNQGLLMKLFNTPMHAQKSYRLKKVFDDLGIMWKEIGKEHEAFQKAEFDVFCQKDEKGELVMSVDPEGKWTGGYEIISGKEPEFAKRQREFGNKEFTIDRFALKLEDYNEIAITVAEVEALEPIFTESAPPAAESENVKPIRA